MTRWIQLVPLIVLPGLPLSLWAAPDDPSPAPENPAPAPAERPNPKADEAPGPGKEKDPRREWLDRFQEWLRRQRPGQQAVPRPGGRPGPSADGEDDEDEKRLDPIQTLEEAARLMSEAEECLFAASARKGIEKGREAEKKLTPPTPPEPPDSRQPGAAPPAALQQPQPGVQPGGAPSVPAPGTAQQGLDKMKLAQEKIDKLLGDADKRQRDTIELINQLIRQARAVQQAQAQKQQHQQQQPQPQSQQPQNTQPNASNPAQRPYTPPPSREGPAPPRSADRADRWGDLPPHMRDETNQGLRQVEEFPAEYRELLQEYYKRLSGSD
jgi:hypothetical protein